MRMCGNLDMRMCAPDMIDQSVAITFRDGWLVIVC